MPAGQPKKFRNGKELIKLFSDFCDSISNNDYTTVPTQTEFCRWLTKNYAECDRRTIYNSLNKYFPNIKKEFEQLQSDTVVTGSMLGHYQPAMSIFALKNWCRWKDREENIIDVTSANGKLTDLIEGLKENDLHTETTAVDETMAEKPAPENQYS